MLESDSEAALRIERKSGNVAQCNAAAAALLGVGVGDTIGTPWHKALACGHISAAFLGQAIAANRYVMLPPFILQRGDGFEWIVGGAVLPDVNSSGEDLVTLLLWPLFTDEVPGLARSPVSGDTLAVIGFDELRYASDSSSGQLASRVLSLASGLRDIVRNGDGVSSPMGSAVVVHLRGVDMQRAQDICRALLSHLHRLLNQSSGVEQTVQLRAGLAHFSPSRTMLATLLAANHAFSLARSGHGNQQVRPELEDDYQVLIAAAINHAGVLGSFVAPLNSPQEVEAPPVRQVARRTLPEVQPMERDIDGYVVDNMEGAVDQALFLAALDVPVAIIGPAGTGKMYVAKVMHDASGAPPEALVQIDCREFKGRKSAQTKLTRELLRSEGRTIVLKSPHLMHSEVQQRLARQIRTRVLSDETPPHALSRVKFIALFPQNLALLIRKGELNEMLASVFSGYPIQVPPIKDRKQAVLRWAHKILVQEGEQRDRAMRGFTPDAEQAMLLYDWPGNISEMRSCISDALEKTDKTWLTPVDLGLFDGIDPEGNHYVQESTPFLTAPSSEEAPQDSYQPTALESLNVALGQAVRAVLELELQKPLGTWLDDELVLAAMERYREDAPRAAEFLHTRSRNIGRWMPKITAREEERSTSAMWQTPRRLVREWVRESSQMDGSPMVLLQQKLLAHVEEQGVRLTSAGRARLMGVSTPTYLKRLKERTSA